MGMSSGGGGGLNSDINVTPMVDIMLVLLIIFMVTRRSSAGRLGGPSARLEEPGRG